MTAKNNQSKTLRLAGSCLIIVTLLCLALLGNDVYADETEGTTTTEENTCLNGAIHAFQYNHDGAGHWRTCTTCGHQEPKTEHEYAIEGEPLSWSCDRFEHWYQCLDCGYRAEVGSHEYGGSSESYCEICGYTDPHAHTWGEWKNTDSHHWKECTECYDQLDKVEHYYKDNCDPDCEACGYERKAPHDLTAYANDRQHWEACACGYSQEAEAHVYDNNCDALCDTCEYDRTAPHDYVWEYDEERHWGSCECGKVDLSPVDHTFDDGICTECGVKTPSEDQNDPAPQKDNTVWIVTIAAIAAMLLAAGALAVRLSKKK